MLQTLFSMIVLAEVSILGQTLWRQLPSVKWALIAHNLCRSLPSQCNSTAYSQHISDLKEAFLFHIKARCTRNDFWHRGIYGVLEYLLQPLLCRDFKLVNLQLCLKAKRQGKGFYSRCTAHLLWINSNPKAARSKNCFWNSASGLLMPLFSDVHVLFLLLRMHSVPATLT